MYLTPLIYAVASKSTIVVNSISF